MSSFWSWWIILLTVLTIVLVTWLLFANRKSTLNHEDGTTGHEYDGIQEYDNPLPAWWFYMFVITIIFGVCYLIAFPGLGNFKGLLGWTQIDRWEKRVAEADEKYGAIFAEYGAMPIELLATDTQAIKMGRRLFANNCAQCHGSDAMGSYGFPNLTDEEWLYGSSPEHIKVSIVQGRSGVMPAWLSALQEQGVVDVSNYVLSLSGRDVDAESALRGKQQYGMFCVACHGAEGKGNQMLGAPDLSNDIWLYGGSPGLVQRSIRNGRGGRMPAHKDMLSKDKIHLLSAYVYSLRQ